MIIVDNALAELEADGSPIRVAVVGAGFQGAAIVRQIITSTRGMRVVGSATGHVRKATQALESAGVDAVCCEGSARIRRAISEGRVVATEDATALVAADGVDVVVEETGSIEYAAGVAVTTIENGKHLVHMNAELDGTVGPILKARADQSGAIYSFSDGDQPGIQMNLLRFLRGIGVTISVISRFRVQSRAQHCSGMQFLAPLAGPVVSVVATAKKDLSVGDVVSEFGGFEAYGLAENQDTVEAENLLSFGLALGAKLVRDIPKDQVLTAADVAMPPGRLVDTLYAEQRARFSPPVLPATTAVR